MGAKYPAVKIEGGNQTTRNDDNKTSFKIRDGKSGEIELKT